MSEEINIYLQKVAERKKTTAGNWASRVGLGAAGGLLGNVAGGGIGAAATGSPIAAGIGAIAGTGLGIYAGVKAADKLHHKKAALEVLEKAGGLAGLASKIIGAGKSAGSMIMNDAKKLPGQIKNVGTAFKANGGMKGLRSAGTLSTGKAILKNKSVIAGAGVAGAGILGSKMMKNKSNG